MERVVTSVTRDAGGPTLLSTPLEGVRSCASSLFVPLGCRSERPQERGLCHLLEHLIFRGTRRYPNSAELLAGFERHGAILSGLTSRDFLVVSYQAEPESVGTLIPLLTEMLLDPCFDDVVLEQEIEIVCSELLGIQDQPHDLCKQLLRKAMWGDHPLGRPVGGSPESVQALTYEQARSFLAHSVTPSSLVLSIAGRVDMAAVAEALPASTLRNPAPPPPLPSPPTQGRQVIVETRSTSTTFVAIGIPILSTEPTQIPVWEMINMGLGQGESSLLFQKVRQEQYLVYDIYSQFSCFRDGMELLVFFNAEPNKCQAILGQIRKQIRALPHLGVEAREIARRRARTHWLFRLESMPELSFWTGRHFMAYDSADMVQLPSRIRAVTDDDFEKLARSIDRFEEFSIAVVGPHSEAEVHSWF